MKLEKLLEFLELEDPSDFEFFENLAELMETDMEIESETMYQMLEAVDMEVMGELLESYFQEILESLPEDAMEMYTLLDSVRMALVGMSKHLEEERDLVLFADELTRFRNWYSLDSTVWVREIAEKKPLREKEMPLRDALTLVRMEQLGGEKYDYIFEEAMDFEMEQYTVTFADLTEESDSGYSREREEELEELDLPGIEYTDHIFMPDKLH